jgi:hypothetical protein
MPLLTVHSECDCFQLVFLRDFPGIFAMAERANELANAPSERACDWVYSESNSLPNGQISVDYTYLVSEVVNCGAAESDQTAVTALKRFERG